MIWLVNRNSFQKLQRHECLGLGRTQLATRLAKTVFDSKPSMPADEEFNSFSHIPLARLCDLMYLWAVFGDGEAQPVEKSCCYRLHIKSFTAFRNCKSRLERGERILMLRMLCAHGGVLWKLKVDCSSGWHGTFRRTSRNFFEEDATALWTRTANRRYVGKRGQRHLLWYRQEEIFLTFPKALCVAFVLYLKSG